MVQEQGFSTSVLLTFEIKSFFVVGGSPPHCRMFSSISDLYSLEARSIPMLLQQILFPNIAKCLLGGKMPLHVKTAGLEHEAEKS